MRDARWYKPATALMFLLLSLLLPFPTFATDSATVMQNALAEFSAEQLFPSADRIGPLSGEPAVARAYRQQEEIGLVFINSAVVNAVGYSGKPIHILVG
jgi:NosR/NirI family nitrous oxide reductase transcriptional regulator